MPTRNTTFTKSFVRRPGAPLGDTSIPIRTEAAPPLRQPTKMQRSKTLTRPERSHPQVPLINPQSSSAGKTSEPGSPAWRIFAKVISFWAIPPCLSACGMKDRATQQAWREKVALVFCALLMGAIVGFVTMALSRVLCPSSQQSSTQSLLRIGAESGYLGIDGWNFNISAATLPTQAQVGVDLYALAGNTSGYDITPLFRRTLATDYPACSGLTGAYATSSTCDLLVGTQDCALGHLNATNLATLKMVNSTRQVSYDWVDLVNSTFANYMILDGHVLNMNPYLAANPTALTNDTVDTAIRLQLNTMLATGGKDGTRLFYTTTATRDAVPCLVEKYYAGRIDKITPGCFVSDMFLYMSLIAILGVVLIRFFMALWFSWFMSWRMSSPPRPSNRKRLPHNVMPEGAISNVNFSGQAPWAGKERAAAISKPYRSNADSDGASVAASVNTLTAQAIGNEPWIICLVTAYSENEEGISTTLTSLAETDYPDNKKLLFVIADGMVTGHGESQSTPDTCVSLLDADARFGTPIPMSFVSVAQGTKAHNMAMVYAGHYTRGKGHRVPMLVVVKCGTPEEGTEGKPGNRGKRDSQMILMNFLQRVTYNDRMTPLDFDLFRKVHALMGVTPDFFELVLMVDADTKVFPAGMRKLSNAMMRDHMIMGACGETRIANKMASWVTAIQVYEYFISHHMVKAFESVFGGVTCLPGCFSMYRIKARKPTDDDWIPIIVKPEVTREYSQSSVRTLHQKNLLLLGEDRFLTTTLLRTFPNRKMVFVPQARCRTEVPHTFKMLLSQRRRWINSTIHNLMELVLVKDLCGTFCFSMQFVVFMDLLGTAVLPVAICLTYILIVSYCLNPPSTFAEAIPLMLLVAVIGLPAVLILLATRKVVYVMWMAIYLVFLPVWNFVLPVYAFWHFDDFSWGETRKVEGELKGVGGHGDGEGIFASASVPLRRWEDWERSRLRKEKREAKRRREMEQQFGGKFWNDPQQLEQQPGASSPLNRLKRRESDAWSETTGGGEEEDVWGAQIGTYTEREPPPATLVFRHTMIVEEDGEVFDADDLEKMLEKEGFDAEEAREIGHSGTIKAKPLSPSKAQARRSQRYSQVPQIGGQKSNGGENPFYGVSQGKQNGSGDPRLHPPLPGRSYDDPRYNSPNPSSVSLLGGGGRHPLAQTTSRDTQHSAAGEISLARDHSPMHSEISLLPLNGSAGYQLEDYGPNEYAAARTTGRSSPYTGGGQAGHARQRSQGTDQQGRSIPKGSGAAGGRRL